MKDDKPPKSSSISGEHRLNLTLTGMTNDELIQKGREKWEPTPSSMTPLNQIMTSKRPPPPKSKTTEMMDASYSLVNASDSIVDGVLLVIGALEEQNKYQKTTNAHLGKIGADLTTVHVELIKTRNENSLIRKIMLTVLIGMFISTCLSLYIINDNKNRTTAEIERNKVLQEQLHMAIKAAEQAKEITTAAAQLSQNKSQVIIKPSEDNPNEAFLEITQPVKRRTAGDVIVTERDVVQIPIKLKDAKIRNPLTTIMDSSLREPKVIIHEGEE